MKRRSSENLEKQIEEAVVAAHGPAEPATGFLTMIEGHVRFPITVKVVGEEVKVASIGVTEDARSWSRSAAAAGEPTKCSSQKGESLVPFRGRSGSLPTSSSRGRGSEGAVGSNLYHGRTLYVLL